jgi:hypothetical protein
MISQELPQLSDEIGAMHKLSSDISDKIGAIHDTMLPDLMRKLQVSHKNASFF